MTTSEHRPGRTTSLAVIRVTFGSIFLCACWIGEAEPIDTGIHLLRIDVPATSLSADPNGQRLFATIAEPSSDYANQLLTLDPDSGEILHALVVGSEPNTAAIADDGSALWVGLRGAQRVLQVDLTRAQPDAPEPSFSLAREGPSGPAWQLSVPVDNANTVFISVRQECEETGFLGLDSIDTTSESVSGATYQFRSEPRAFASLAAGASGFLFGYDSVGPDFGFYVLDTGAPPPPTLDEYPDLITGLADLHYAGGYVFSDHGEVIDVRDPATALASRAGRFPNSGVVVPAADGRRAWMLTEDEGSIGTDSEPVETAPCERRPSVTGALRLLAFSVDGFALSAEYELGAGHFQKARSLVRVGEDTFAFIAEDAGGPAVFTFSLP